MPAELLQYLVPSTFDARAVSHSFRGVARPNVNVTLGSLHGDRIIPEYGDDEDEDDFGVNPDDLDSLQRALGWANVVSVSVNPCLWRSGEMLVDHPDEWDALLHVLQQCTSIVTLDLGSDSAEELYMYGNQIAKLAAILPQLPKLRNLYLNENEIEQGTRELLNVLPQCTSLSRLDLSENYLCTKDMEDLMNSMQRCTHIKELIIDNNHVLLRDAEMVIPTSNLSLTRLSLNALEIAHMDQDMEWLAGVLRHCPSLTSLALNEDTLSFHIDDMENVSAALSSCTRLTWLDISDNDVRESIQELFAVLPQLPLLQYFNIENGSEMDRNDFLTLNGVLGRCTSLTSLNIGGKTPGGEYSNLFVQLRSNCPLKKLYLRNTGLADHNHIERLILTLPAFTSLQMLDVSGNRLRHDQITRLEESKSPAQRDNLEIIY